MGDVPPWYQRRVDQAEQALQPKPAQFISERSRPSWDEWGIELARAVAFRADCTRRQVGAVIMTPDHSIVATGYNGAPSGEPGCLTKGACPRGRSGVAPGSSYDTGAGVCIAVHAEQNAVLRASWVSMEGSTLFITDSPCDGCLRMIKGTPIARIVAPDYEWNRA